MSQSDDRPIPRNRPPLSARKPTPLPEGLQKMLARAKAELAGPFKGITTDGTPVPGLFPIHRTGVSLAALVTAARDFITALSETERAQACLGLDSEAWRSWSNVHPYLMRHGICLEDLGEAGRAAAFAVVRESLSASGFESARNVMKLNEHLREITGRTEEFSEWFYWLSLFGTPDAVEPWGWQLDGHHLIINCVVLGDQIVLTPNFMGSEPVRAKSGKYAGVEVFHAEESSGLALIRALGPAQRAKAIIGTQLPGETFATAFRDNLELAYQGIRYGDLTPDQQALLVQVIEVYVGRIRPGHAEIKIEEVRQHLGDTHFAWIGGFADEAPFYYRIHSPVILVEFDHQPGVALLGDEPSRNHIHTVVRTPNGNDYGKDLLRQHYEQFDHSHPHTPHRLGRE